MQKRWPWFLSIVLTLGLAGCVPEGEERPEETSAPPAGQSEEAWEEFRRTTNARMQELEREMDGLGQRVSAAGEEADAELNEQMAEWRRDFDDLERRVQEFEGQTEQEWREFEGTVRAQLDELDRSLDRFSERLNEPAR